MTPEELELLVDRLAGRLRELVPARVELLDPAGLAERLGVSRDFVYDHAGELGAVKLGSRLAFRWPDALDRLPQVETPCDRSERSEQSASPGATGSRRSRRAIDDADSGHLMPVGPRRSNR